ncbi:hypothetical protein THRCLA_05804 [Thraustotheca clavata]|uniref:Uncharacterized protein n=1 Tax=Thraustotheca clavata TaxID=74557 RepID=A0A1V9ZSF9_9STRA|nr:hypothetical protein THRCLA_05804 [Thraustotheca clavata]
MPSPVALKRQRLVAEKAMLEASLKLINDGEHVDLLARLVPLQQDKKRIEEVAATREHHLKASAKVIFAYESEQAEKEYVAACAKLKHDMLEEIRSEMNRAVAQRAQGSASGPHNKTMHGYNNQTSRRHTRSRKKPHAAFALGDDWNSARTKRPSTVFTPLAMTLSANDVDSDLRLLEESAEVFAQDTIQAERTGNEDESSEHNPIFARLEKGKLLYKDWILQEGDEIAITKSSNVSYVAIICDLTSAEIFVLKENGKYSRVLVQDLRAGAVNVSPIDPEEVGEDE